MHVAFLNMPIEYYSPVSGGAISTIIMQTARELIARGHQVTVLTRVSDDLTYDVGKVVPLRLPSRDSLSPLSRLVSRARGKMNRWDWPYYEYYLSSFSKAIRALREPPDVVVVFNDLITPKYLRRLLPGAKLVVWLQNEQGTRHLDISAAIDATDAYLTCSQYIREWTLNRYPIPPARVTVAHSGVDLQAFFPRSGFLSPVNALRVLFLGRLDPNKGPDIAVDAVASLRKEGLPIGITVVGSLWFYGNGDPMHDPFFRELSEKMTAAQATHLGHLARPQVPEIVRQHDVVCILSRSNEPFGLVVLEAMASGCAVIASNRGGLPEACGGAAALVDPDDAAAVRECLRSLVQDPQALADMKKRSVERAAAGSWGACADRLESVVASVANQAGLASRRKGSSEHEPAAA
jgi:glycosyltransferase involved in cell wall biosynthesis